MTMNDTNTDTMTKEHTLATVPDVTDKRWQEIVDTIVDELTEEDLPDNVVRATELLLAGYPTYKAAKKVGVKPATVRRWLTKYPVMTAVVEQGRKLLSEWRLTQLEQQFLTAIERNQEILELDLTGAVYSDKLPVKIDPKILTVVAAQTRYMIGLYAGQKVDVTVTHEAGETVLKAREDGWNYIADQLRLQDTGDEPIEAVYKVIDSKMDSNSPVLDEKGNSNFGELGFLDRNVDGSLCHVCGSRYKSLNRHLGRHNMSTTEYETLYILEEGMVRKMDKVKISGH